MEVIVGTYEGPIISYTVKLGDDITLEPQFIEKSHSGCVKCLACNGRYLASGSSDETIRLLDLHKRCELGALMQHSGTVTCLAFHGQHLLSGSEDGTICVYQCGTWECQKVMKGHNAPITQLSTHPSGVLTLSVSKDKTLKTWSLITGRPVHTVNLVTLPDSVVWNTDGSSYAILSDKVIQIYQPHSGLPVRTYTSPTRIVTLKFISPTLLAYGGEDKNVTVIDVETEAKQILTGHQSRIKSLDFVKSDVAGHSLLVSVSSDGEIRVWAMSPTKHEHIGGTTIPHNRPVCMCVYTGEKQIFKHSSLPAKKLTPQIIKKKKRKRKSTMLFANLHAIQCGKIIHRRFKHKKGSRLLGLKM